MVKVSTFQDKTVDGTTEEISVTRTYIHLTGINTPILRTVVAQNNAVLMFTNVTSTSVVIKHNTGTTATNRFWMRGAADLTLAQNETARFYYDTVLTRWIQM